MKLYLFCALLGLAGPSPARAEHPWDCEYSLAGQVRTLNVLWDLFETMRRAVNDEHAPRFRRAVDFKTYAVAHRFLQSLVFVDNYRHTKRDDAEAIQTYLLWRFERRRDAFEITGVGRADEYGLVDGLAELATYVEEKRFARLLGGPIGKPSRVHLDLRVQPHLPKLFWPMVASTVSSGVLFDDGRGVYFVKYNGFVHVLQPTGEGESVDYAVYKIANRANVGGPLHFAYFLELLRYDLGSDPGQMTDLQEMFFERYPRLMDVLLPKDKKGLP